MPEVQKKFAKAEAFLLQLGYEPLNPLDIVPYHPGTTWETYMAHDILALQKCKGIYMLHDWRNSQGARLEYEIAQLLGLIVIEMKQ